MTELHGIANASEGIRYGGKTDPAIIHEIFVARMGRPSTPDERDAFIDAYIPKLHELLVTKGVEVLAGVVDTLHYLQAQPVRLGVATGNVRRGAEAKLGAAGLTQWFDCG